MDKHIEVYKGGISAIELHSCIQHHYWNKFWIKLTLSLEVHLRFVLKKSYNNGEDFLLLK